MSRVFKIPCMAVTRFKGAFVETQTKTFGKTLIVNPNRLALVKLGS